MNFNNRLKKVDIESLDPFEITFYNDYRRKFKKAAALQKIIDNAEGDYTKLSDVLAEIAKEAEKEN